MPFAQDLANGKAANNGEASAFEPGLSHEHDGSGRHAFDAADVETRTGYAPYAVSALTSSIVRDLGS